MPVFFAVACTSYSVHGSQMTNQAGNMLPGEKITTKCSNMSNLIGGTTTATCLPTQQLDTDLGGCFTQGTDIRKLLKRQFIFS